MLSGVALILMTIVPIYLILCKDDMVTVVRCKWMMGTTFISFCLSLIDAITDYMHGLDIIFTMPMPLFFFLVFLAYFQSYRHLKRVGKRSI